MSKQVADRSIMSGTDQSTAEIDLDQSYLEITLGDFLRAAARASGERIALVDGVADPALRRRWTYDRLLQEAEQLARALLGRFQPGDRIAICAPNSPEWVIAEFGVALAGMVLVPLNPGFLESELKMMLEECGATALIHADSWRGHDIAARAAKVCETALPDLALLSLSDWDVLLASGTNGTALPAVNPRDLVILQFTSGTTGRPKGAMLHHGSVNPPRSVATCCGLETHDVWLNSMPMYHIGGAVISLLATVSRRGTFVQMREWDPSVALELIESERCNGMLLVPTMVVGMLDHPSCAERDLSSVKFILTGAAPVPPALLDRVTNRVGCRMLNSFGQTESGGSTSNTRIGDGPEELAGTIGRALPNVEIEVRDPNTHAKLGPGEMGEMWFRGRQIMLGYYGRDEETRATIMPDGWLRSGDLVMMDKRGYISIAGRLKDMIIRGGVNIYPREVEDVLFDHSSVAQAAVIGLPDEKWGEIVVAVVQAADGRALDFHDLHQHCRARLAAFKVPVLWCLAKSLPLNPTGKIQKFTLIDWVRDGQLQAVPVR